MSQSIGTITGKRSGFLSMLFNRGMNNAMWKFLEEQDAKLQAIFEGPQPKPFMGDFLRDKPKPEANQRNVLLSIFTESTLKPEVLAVAKKFPDLFQQRDPFDFRGMPGARITKFAYAAALHGPQEDLLPLTRHMVNDPLFSKLIVPAWGEGIANFIHQG
ncbi:MAG TPA: hypothetical protein VM532_09755, partial [Burkholderiales bacterium]|nr:hypothetical protein [Burkholderiales bacterium]